MMRSFISLFAGASIASTSFAMDIPTLQEEAISAGITHSYEGPWEYFVGGGVAVMDCNGDRMPDLFFAGGKEPAKLFINQSKIGGALAFKRHDIGIKERELKKTLGAYPIDFDNDGILDLVSLRLGPNLLLKGDGKCGFTKANTLYGYKGGKAWTTAFAAQFEPDQIFPTMAFGNYVDRNAPGSPWGTCDDNLLLRPKADQKQPDYSAVMPLSPGYCTLSMLFTDWNKSGENALRMTNDRQYYRGGQEQLWRVTPNEQPQLYTANEGWEKVVIWGMGIAEADLNADGFPDYALTSMGDTKMQVLDDEADEESPIYRDIAFERGATAHRPYAGGDIKPSTGWHAQFDDLNNDARLDLFIAKGNVSRMPDFAAFDPDNLLLGTHDAKFIEAGAKAGINLKTRGRGGATVDLNADGMLDLVVVNREANVSVFRNLGDKTEWGHRPMGNWLQLELSQDLPNSHAIGAEISIKTGNLSQTRRIKIGGGHASGQLGFIHVGLGVAERAQIRVKWPDGEWSAPYRVFANNFVSIKKDANDVRYWFPSQ